jgi:hypothetical protein
VCDWSLCVLCSLGIWWFFLGHRNACRTYDLCFAYSGFAEVFYVKWLCMILYLLCCECCLYGDLYENWRVKFLGNTNAIVSSAVNSLSLMYRTFTKVMFTKVQITTCWPLNILCVTKITDFKCEIRVATRYNYVFWKHKCWNLLFFIHSLKSNVLISICSYTWSRQ